MPAFKLFNDLPQGENEFDYIITGAGCAGLSLLMHLLQQPLLRTKKILVLDENEKDKNDRTWCFWETTPGLFEPIVHKSWQQIDFYSAHFSARFDIVPYSYKMIRGLDFYNHVLQSSEGYSNVSFYKTKVEMLGNEGDKAFVVAEGRKLHARYVFNSILFEDISQYPLKEGGFYYLLQHFKGWIIETKDPVFELQVARFMDFRVPQDNGLTFVYTLPLNANKALVEYTLFSPAMLKQDEYDKGLRDYIAEYLNVADYTICEKEFGVIPMTNYPFSKGEGNIVSIGTAGGQTKSSSGYTFRFIQKHSAAIVAALLKNEDPHISKSLSQKRFDLYDSTLLQILTQKKMTGDRIFADMFKSNHPQLVLKFLDNETSITEEIKLMSSVSSAVFLPAAFKEMFKGI
ncbi:lycopene cyclase family protein [Foetidibacter luteolus]|uniref:lycopene cyclase family protein n=1 Tax=Foetidibacter luteolus TaxID=2608880 RepID=UPI00129B4DB6|nr:lycopene cyclase family protein [Foetidibacter luteolus]